MIPRESSGPLLRDLSACSGVKMQYDFILNRIKDAKEKWKVDLNAQEKKAEAIWRDFQDTQDEEGENRALSSYGMLSLETGRITALGKIEFMFAEIERMAAQAVKLALDLGKVVEVARHTLQLCREEFPTATPRDVEFKEHAATTTMMIAKNDIHKKVAVKRIENIVLEYQDWIEDPENVKILFEEYATKLNRLSRINRPTSIELRDNIVEEFREAVEFTIPTLALMRSGRNKGIALSRMVGLLNENPEIKDDPSVKKLFEDHSQKLQSEGLQKALECEQHVRAFYTAVRNLYSA